ncbi:Dyp-type peroxidase [Streptomyces sp. UNOC14_S4]|uniref:Dyp-type peroxidase n=1 Tax=Streptomyces sp. UNOC14_S4 TaxID=2872340 RepID=UPI001E543EE8|nr:Dyp-type peroxidase [Streptomyces sp. UNOC14_S4]MCC3766198.1 Dyp-type peroxidase [Streptomyces sp. UNOC14_S4]
MSEPTATAVPALELDDIQGTVLRRRPDDYHGVYLLYRIDDPAAAKRSLREVLPKITSAADWERPRPFTLNIAFTYQGLARLGVPQDSLASFSEEFRAGMAARKEVLGDLGANDPGNWVPPLGGPDVHIGVMIIAETVEGLREPVEAAGRLAGVSPVYRLDVGVPVTGHEHFGFRDGISSPYLLGSADRPLPGQDPVRPGEFLFGYPDESGAPPKGPAPDVLGRNGCYLAFRQLHADVAGFRRYLRDNARSPEDEELLAAKIVGRWRSGAPLALAPEHDDPELGADPARNNDFLYHDDPRGLRVPRGAHIRRANPRDSLTDSVVVTGIHRVLRRGAAYGPLLPDGVLEDDGAERGIIFVFMGASLSRQFEFVQQVWLNDGDFAGLGAERDPLVGNNDGTGVHTVPALPVRRRLTGLPRFVTVRGGEYCFLPGLTAIEWLTALPDPDGGPPATPRPTRPENDT